jgi:voltage-gated potassium channel Kch
MRNVTTRDRLRYRFDNIMSRGTAALIGWLFLITALLILVVATVVVITGMSPGDDGQRMSFAAAAWMTLMRAMDAGTVAGDTGSYAYMGAMFLVTLGGIFLVSILIGLLTSGIESRLEELRKGRSFVCEEGHTLILGWNPQIFSILEQLTIAKSSQADSVIVILADKDKVEMEDSIRERIGATGRTRIVCRSGSPIDPADISIVNPEVASSVILLAAEDANPDYHVIKSMLALLNAPSRRADRYHIVAEIRDPKNLDVARMVAGDEVQLVPVEEVVASITVQTCRQSGLSVVYTELLDFDGDEIYLHHEPSLVGKTFGDTLSVYETSCVMGLKSKTDGVRLNPPMDTVIAAGDLLVVIAEDDSSIVLAGRASPADASAIRAGSATPPASERLLLLGWNRRSPLVINQLDAYVAPGSTVVLMADSDSIRAELDTHCASLTNLTVELVVGDATDRKTLESLTRTHFDHVITMSSSEELDVQAADARTLITLLQLRDIGASAQREFSIVSEMLDLRNRELAAVTRADDFIVSDRMVSMLLSQISESRDLAAVFADLFDPDGAEIYLKPCGDFVEPGRAVSFYTIVEAARRRGEVAIGYRVKASSTDASKAYGVRLNPKKDEMITLSELDRIIVLANA